ncbi:ABC transporter substrate-binding protein, partial [Nocardioides guangzhouensis]
FATDVITGGPTYVLGYLDVPHGADGLPEYKGPYKGGASQADFDKAVTCDGNKLTMHFNQPWADLPLAVAALRSFDPYRKDKDEGDKNNYVVFSNGPYKLDGKWNPNGGGTFVRNTEYDPKSDETGTRKALPDKIVYTQGDTDEVIYDRLIADSGDDQFAVTDRRIPPAYYTQITGAVEDRSTLLDTPYVDYWVPNFKKVTNLKVRQALMLATNAQGYLTALGGPNAGAVAKSVVSPTLVGYQDNPNFTQPPEGDPEAAKALLEESGEQTPYPLKVTYQSGTPSLDKSAGALADTWTKAGFKVTLDPQVETFYTVIQKPSADFDAVIAGWAADWPSQAAVLPPLFDSRINLVSSETNGSDYGNFQSDTVNKLIDEAAAIPDVEEAGKKWAAVDDQLGKEVAYVPLRTIKYYYLNGSKVTGFLGSPNTGVVDLGVVGVEN